MLQKKNLGTRIAYIVTPTEFGGAARVSLNFLRNVNRHFFNIYLILLLRPWEQTNLFLERVQNLNYPVSEIPVAKRPASQGTDYLRILRCLIRILTILRNGSFDLIHTHGYFADILGIVSAKVLRIPVISTSHGFIENDRKLSLYNRLDRFFLRFSDEIIAVSNDIRNILVSAGIKPNIIKVIPNAVATNIDEPFSLIHRQAIRQRFAFSEKDFVLGYVGRLSQEKGLLSLIQAVSLARKAGCHAKLLIIGEGNQGDELRDAARKEQLRDAVVFAGFQNDVGPFFSAMEVFVLPSLNEGTPMALLEAMAHGIPSIASAVGQIPNIIDSAKTGILVPPGNVIALRDAILSLYKSPSMRKRIGEKGRKTIEDQFDIQRWVKRIEAEYISLIEQHRGP